MQWAGAGVVWSFAGGVPASHLLAANKKTHGEDFTFVQISDSHIGFSRPANTDVGGTLQAAVDKINALERAPDFLIHTGDLTHLAKPGEFDTLDQLLRGLRQPQVFEKHPGGMRQALRSFATELRREVGDDHARRR